MLRVIKLKISTKATLMLFRNPHCWFRQGMKALSANGEMHPATCRMPRAERSRSPDRSDSRDYGRGTGARTGPRRRSTSSFARRRCWCRRRRRCGCHSRGDGCSRCRGGSRCGCWCWCRRSAARVADLQIVEYRLVIIRVDNDCVRRTRQTRV